MDPADSVPTPGDGQVRELLVVSRLLREAADAHGSWFARPVAAALRIDTVAADARVVADERRINRVLIILLRNAYRHGGGVTTVRVWVEGNDLRVAVDDAGPGIPYEMRQEIFGPAAGLPASDVTRAESAPSGLAWVHRYVTAEGGSVTAEASPSGGARLLLRLPLAPTPVSIGEREAH